MKQLTLSLAILLFLISLFGCERKPSDTDTTKIQESIDKIKAKIQETMVPAENASDPTQSDIKKKEQEKNKQ